MPSYCRMRISFQESGTHKKKYKTNQQKKCRKILQVSNINYSRTATKTREEKI